MFWNVKLKLLLRRNADAVNKAIALYNTNQYSIKEITELTGVSKSTLYRSIKG